MTTLVTGATGFVGSAVLRVLLDAGHSVRALVRAGSDRRNIDGLDVELVTGDLTQPDSLGAALKGCRALFHVAADYRLWARDPRVFYAVNVEGTKNLLDVALRAGVERVVYTSSVATLGILPGDQAADEGTQVSLDDMISHYKRSKFIAEQQVQNFVREGQLPAVIVNPSAPVGPRDIKPTPTGRMILDAAEGRMPAYVDTGLNIVHVDDVATGHLLAFQHGVPGERYILGGTNMSLKQILTEVAAIAGRRAPRISLPHYLILPFAYAAQTYANISGREPRVTVDGVRLARKRMYFSSEKAHRELGFASRPARAALEDAVAWFRKNRTSGRAN